MRRLGLAFGILVVAAFVYAVTAVAATTYSDYVVYGEQGVMIGAGSEVDGLVGARSNNSDYAGQPTPALNMNGGAKILGTARVGEDVTVANTVTITTLYYVGTFTQGSGFTGTATQVADADLPAGTLASQSVWPGGLGSNCPPVGGLDHTGLPNGFNLTLTPGNYGDIAGGGAGSLTFNGAGDYFLNSLRAGNGLTIHVPTPGVRVFVCEDVVLGSGSVQPTSLLPAQFSMEVAGIGVAAGTNAFTATSFDWIGNLLVPSRGIHLGSSGGGATWLGYLWGDHVDIEHGVVLTKLAKKTGVKWNDMNGNGVRDLPEDVGKAGFTIQLRDSTNTSVVQSAVTDGNGKYEFVDIFPDTYYVCEVQQQDWIQTYPNAATPDPLPGKDEITDQCPAPAIYGYLITVENGDDLNADDFGNVQLASKSGTKYEDQANDGTSPFQGTLDNWVIRLFGTDGLGNPVTASTTTGPNGTYSFPGLYPGSYTVCEELLDPSWTQTYPTATSTDGTACDDAGYAAGGYTFTLLSGQAETGNDFANFREPVGDEPRCQKQTVIDTMNLVFPGNGGPDDTVLTYLPESVQTAVDNATDSNLDGYIIIMVIAHADGSLGGTANQKVVVDKDYTATPATNLPFGLFGCSVTLTGGGSDPSVWVKTTAKGKQVTINGRKTNIFVMDLQGSNSSVAGVEADGTYRYLRNEYGSNSTVGIKVVGNYNTVHNGAATGNTGDGVSVTGDYNLLTDTNSMSNGANGFNVAGNYNQLLKLDAGERGTGDTGDGVHVAGNTNTLSEIDAYANLGDGIDVAGNGNILTKNVAGDPNKGNGFAATPGSGFRIAGVSNNLTENKASANKGDGFYVGGTIAQTSATANLIKNNLSNTGASGSDLENLGKEWRFFYFIKNNGGGNKADGTTLANGVKGLTNFPASGATFNYGAGGQGGE